MGMGDRFVQLSFDAKSVNLAQNSNLSFFLSVQLFYLIFTTDSKKDLICNMDKNPFLNLLFLVVLYILSLLKGERNMTYSYWQDGQGTKAGKHSPDADLDDCALMRVDYDFKWYDVPCRNKYLTYPYICQFGEYHSRNLYLLVW